MVVIEIHLLLLKVMNLHLFLQRWVGEKSRNAIHQGIDFRGGGKTNLGIIVKCFQHNSSKPSECHKK